MPKRTAVTVVKIKNFSTGISDICAHKLTTSAVEQPMISRPPMISPQRMLLSSMNELSTLEKGRRARGGGCGRGGGGGGIRSRATGTTGTLAGSSGAKNVGTGSMMIF